MSAKWSVQESLYNALTNNTTFMSLINNRLYDEPPTNSKYPYVILGNATEVTDNRHEKIGYELTFTFNIYTKSEGLGYYQGDKIYNAMNDVLNMQKLTVTNYKMLICKLDNVMWDREGDKRVIDVRYRIICHKSDVVEDVLTALEIQQKLILLGYTLTLTGVKDLATETAIKDFQMIFNLPVHGYFDNATLLVANEVIERKNDLEPPF
jgi:hypothetical protein